MSLKVKLSLLVSGLVAAAVLVAGLFQFSGERRTRLAEAEARLEACAARLGELADKGLEADDFEKLATAARADLSAQPLLFSAVVRADGRTLWREGREGYSEPLDEHGVRGALGAGRALRSEQAVGGRPSIEWTVPLKTKSAGATGATGTRPLGVVLRTGFDAAEVRAAAAAAAAPALNSLLLGACVAILLGLGGATFLAESITGTIKKLMQGAQEVGAGHFSVRVQTRRGDELGDLSDEFNLMGHKLAELERLKDSFLAKITHDLRSPLAAITCYADVMLMGVQGPLTEKQQNSLKLVVQSGNDLAELVNNILDLTKLEAGKMAFAPGEVGLKSVAQAAVDLLQLKAAEYGVGLEATGVPEETIVWADEQALKRLITNLLSNSLKFTPKDGKVSVHWHRADNGDDVISVKDTGIGIPADKISTLFEKFSQVEETMHKVRFARGTGLGLAICKEIAEGHGGRIWVESEYQKGSDFSVSLPKRRAA